ncbi:MAG TPA: ABC transporter permease [Candidatus Acidoferrales bacterium]|nr:ABC transporter permease [Candidatus Acidoferrales bacterium]
MTTLVTAAPEVGAPASLHPRRSSATSSRIALGALLLRDLVVLKKRLREFIPRTIVQPFLLCFVFLYVFPTIGQGVGGGGGAAGESAFATILVAGVVGLSVMFQGIQAVALPMVQEFGYTKEIEDRVLAPLPVSLVALEKVLFGAIQGLIAAAIVFPIAAVVHAGGVHIDLQVHWLQLVTLIPLACITTSALGLTFGTIFDPRTVPLLFGIIILPITFLGGTYYSWTTLAPVTIGSFHWLQVLVLVNPLIYINEGMRGALTSAPHMSLWVVYPVLLGFCAFFLWVGTRNFRKRVIS